MQLHHEIPDFAFAFRSVGGSSAVLEDREQVRLRELDQSFIVTPTLLETWQAPATVAGLTLEHLAPVLDLKPELVILGVGSTQQFPPAKVMAECLSRGIGLEAMTNTAAARTFNLLASEGRNVAAAMLLAG
ncbi:MTH938/NDUFAF3 family protein [uncultured Stenotrophomonas sp.]|uniref:Mth938-like domain-containing protein n=1 Tax=uncultured Stenotrophomonas sp. TaxID=165438 RepID=UPI0028E5F850|nr:MTH938/NDUFAF3 family protein [uncultured Stenotrophomonas sp.]